MTNELCSRCGRQIIKGTNLENFSEIALDADTPVYYVAGNRNEEFLIAKAQAFVEHSVTCPSRAELSRKAREKTGIELR